MTSEQLDATYRIVASLSAVCTPKLSVLDYRLTVSSNDADNGHSGSIAAHCDRITVSRKEWAVP